MLDNKLFLMGTPNQPKIRCLVPPPNGDGFYLEMSLCWPTLPRVYSNTGIFGLTTNFFTNFNIGNLLSLWWSSFDKTKGVLRIKELSNFASFYNFAYLYKGTFQNLIKTLPIKRLRLLIKLSIPTCCTVKVFLVNSLNWEK